MSAYFDGIKVGDKIYRLNDSEPWEVTSVCSEFVSIRHGGLNERIDKNGGQVFGLRIVGQLWFWQPVHVDAPPRPKRWKKITLQPVSPILSDYSFALCGGYASYGNAVTYHRPINSRNYQHPTCEVEE
jgi:hypothetical protein